MLLTNTFPFIVFCSFNNLRGHRFAVIINKEFGADVLVETLELRIVGIKFVILQHVPVFRIRWNTMSRGRGGIGAILVLDIEHIIR